jgi:uncharacterized protein with HEPN domain
VKEDRPYLEHIREAIQRIRSYTADGWEAFARNTMAQDAVVRNFQVIGEATKQISEATRQRHPDIPWRQIAGFRDVLIHDYMGVNLRRVWNVIEQHLPQLEKAVDELLAEG